MITKSKIYLLLLSGLLSSSLFARSIGSIICIYNYSGSTYQAFVDDVDNYDWGDANNRPDHNLRGRVLGPKNSAGLPGILCAHEEVNANANYPRFTLILYDVNHPAYKASQIIYKERAREEGSAVPTSAWYSELNSPFRGSATEENAFNFSGIKYWPGWQYRDLSHKQRYCGGNDGEFISTEFGPVWVANKPWVDYTTFSGDSRWGCSVFYVY